MKKYYYLLLVSLAAFMAASCSDEIESDANDTAAVKSGQPICLYNVGDQATDNGKKKMHYGEKDADNNWPVCWDVNDAADVLCPEARWSDNPHAEATDVPSVSYKVNALTGTSGTIVPADDKELCWGQANAHHFFHAFPAGTVDLSDVTKNKYSDNTNDYSADFTATISQSQVIPADSIKQDADGNWTARNMNYAVLVGTDRYMREELDEKEPIHLHYNTAFTAVEITIGACGTGAFDGDVITAVDITNATTNNTGYEAMSLAGEFTGTVGYNASGTYANNFANSTTPSKLFNNVRIDLSAKPVTLEANSGKTLKVTAFLLPTANAQVKVTVNRRKIKSGTPGAPLTISKSFKGADNALDKGKVNHIGMGSLPITETNKIDGNNWMSVLPDETYLSQMSIPGVYDCGAYRDEIHDADQAQYQLVTPADDAAQMKAYLAAGNRAFDFKLNAKDSDEDWDLIRENTNKQPVSFSFENMVKAAQDWLADHETECVICIISDYNKFKEHSGTANYDSNGDYIFPDGSIETHSDIYNAHIRNYIIGHTPDKCLLPNFDEKITLGEARGKMVIINASDYPNPIGLSSQWVINLKPDDSTWFQETRTKENETDLTGYSFTNGKHKGIIYVQDFNNLQRRSGENNTIQAAAEGGSFEYDANRKKGFIKNALNKAREDSNIPNWYYISTACRGWAFNYDNPPTMCSYHWAMEKETYTTGFLYWQTTYESYNIRQTVRDYITGEVPTDSYQKLGIVMNSCVAHETVTEENPRTLEQMIWENNYVGNGPLTKSSATK